MSAGKKTSVITAGLALFSMFFGAGNLIWPIILGEQSGDKSLFALLGLVITGVSLPFLGLIAMMLFDGDNKSFFARIGKLPCLFLLFIIQALIGPFGAVPRIIALSYGTLKSYLPEGTSLLSFSILFSVIVLFFTLRKNRIIELLGTLLTPILLLSLGALFAFGLPYAPEAKSLALSTNDAFTSGLKVGYNTLDLIASFLFAPMVLAHFTGGDRSQDKKAACKKMLQASSLAAFLLGIIYLGLIYLSAHYAPVLGKGLLPEEKLREIALLILGPKGALVASVAVVLACLTTAIPLIAISSDYIRQDLLKNRGGSFAPLFIALAISALIANLGFMGIAHFLSPILQILCPGLIVLSVLNILHKLYEIQVAKVPVYAAFALSTIGYAAMI